jgi:hypothetical protein
MNLAELQKKLLAAARSNPPDEHVPYAFEQRVMARLAEKPAGDTLAIWNRTLWQAAAPCVAVMLLLGAWTFLAPRDDNSGETLAADLESTLSSPFDNQTETW